MLVGADADHVAFDYTGRLIPLEGGEPDRGGRWFGSAIDLDAIYLGIPELLPLALVGRRGTGAASDLNDEDLSGAI